MIIRVTQKHIREARARINKDIETDVLCSICPVAQALHEQTGIAELRVYENEIVRGQFWCDEAPRAHFPRSVERFVKKFDAGLPVKPFNFKLVWR